VSHNLKKLQISLEQWFSTFTLRGAKSRFTTSLEGRAKDILTQVCLCSFKTLSHLPPSSNVPPLALSTRSNG